LDGLLPAFLGLMNWRPAVGLQMSFLVFVSLPTGETPEKQMLPVPVDTFSIALGVLAGDVFFSSVGESRPLQLRWRGFSAECESCAATTEDAVLRRGLRAGSARAAFSSMRQLPSSSDVQFVAVNCTNSSVCVATAMPPL
jgi:hypothetical protein